MCISSNHSSYQCRDTRYFDQEKNDDLTFCGAHLTLTAVIDECRTGAVPGGGKGAATPYHFQKKKNEKQKEKRGEIKKKGGKQ